MLRIVRNTYKMHNMTNTSGPVRVSSTELRSKARNLLDLVQRGGRAEIDRYGEPLAVLMPKRAYDEMASELDRLRVELRDERAARRRAEDAACFPGVSA